MNLGRLRLWWKQPPAADADHPLTEEEREELRSHPTGAYEWAERPDRLGRGWTNADDDFRHQ